MHAAVVQFVWEAIDMRDREGKRFRHVIELGSRNVNGSVRSLFGPCSYWGMDLLYGPGVDYITDCTKPLDDSWGPCDAVVCTNVLEHVENWERMISNAACLLEPQGWFILTVPGPQFPRHSGHDGLTLRPGEHYRAVPPAELVDAIECYGLGLVNSCFTDQDSMIVASK